MKGEFCVCYSPHKIDILNYIHKNTSFVLFAPA